MKGRKGIETKNLIRKMAFYMFLSKDYHTVSLKDIEKRTHLSRGCTVYHYNGKQALFIDVIDYYILKTEGSYPPSECLENKSLKEFIHGYINHIREKLNYYDQFLLSEVNMTLSHAYINLLLHAEEYYPGFKAQIEDIYAKELQLWETMIGSAQKTGEINPRLDCTDVARQFVLLLRGIYHTNTIREGFDMSIMEMQFLLFYYLIKL